MANLLSGDTAGSLKADGGSLKIDGRDAFADALCFRNILVLCHRRIHYGEAVGKR
ncbi:MAG: hypothetical protein ACLRMX_10265 [Lachnospira eligens]